MVFGTLVKEEQEFENDEPDIEGFDEFILNTDMNDGTPFTGKPYLGEMYDYVYTDEETGKEIMNYRANFWIINKENQEVLKTQLKLKNLEDDLTFWKKSVGFDLVNSIETLADPKFKGKHNKINISFKELHDYINSLKEITINTIGQEAKINGNDITWNTIEVVEAV